MNKRTLVILLLVLLLLVTLFIVSLLLEAREPGSGLKLDPKSPGLASAIARWLSRPAKAEYLTLHSGSPADCHLEKNQITIKAGTVCVYIVETDKLWTRKLRLRQESSGQVNVLLSQQDALDVPQALLPGKASDPFDIYGRQDQTPATLKIEALSLPPFDQREYVIDVLEE